LEATGIVFGQGKDVLPGKRTYEKGRIGRLGMVLLNFEKKEGEKKGGGEIVAIN